MSPLMNDQERNQINRRFAKLCYPGKDCTYNPDFISNPRLVLGEMKKGEDWDTFAYVIGSPFWESDKDGRCTDIKHYTVDIDYILDETEGLLVKAAIEFLRRRRRNERGF